MDVPWDASLMEGVLGAKVAYFGWQWRGVLVMGKVRSLASCLLKAECLDSWMVLGTEILTDC